MGKTLKHRDTAGRARFYRRLETGTSRRARARRRYWDMTAGEPSVTGELVPRLPCKASQTIGAQEAR